MTTSVPQYISPLEEMKQLDQQLILACINSDAQAVAELFPRLKISFQKVKSMYHDRPAWVIEMSKAFEKLEESAAAVIKAAK